ncbi:N-acetylmannosamine kinase [Vibrio sp. S17_S38]|uniref:N-acetylmannosamine kinase n=1 Tax=Vibrio sp. S17_S38 TaxID=2720229 RepID=UPI0016819FE2|nr:N-acetylmannosamine kinase [Vibrio sp. S17_S38]MBD1572130.1 N-acetylmannosamine kinase [Vibrio sp. S17_S38]
MSKILAVDLGGTKIAVAMVVDNQIITRKQVPTPTTSKQMTMVLSELLIPFINEAEAVAVASTGIINNGILTALNPENLGGLDHFPIQSTIENITHLPTMVINDAQAAAWAEFQLLDDSVSNMAFITISTGVGAGLVIDKALQIGKTGLSGHAGHMLADPNGPNCGCGRKGCVEAIASGTAIGVEGQAFWGNECTGQMVYQHFLAGNLDAKAIINHSAKTIANLIADLTISLDLETVVLGGSVGLAEQYLQQVQHYLQQHPTAYQTNIKLAHFGADAGLLGAANLYCEKL